MVKSLVLITGASLDHLKSQLYQIQLCHFEQVPLTTGRLSRLTCEVGYELCQLGKVVVRIQLDISFESFTSSAQFYG